MVALLPFSIILLLSVNAFSAEIVLNQKKVAELALKQGFSSQEKIYEYDVQRLQLSEYLLNYGWLATLEAGQTLDRSEDLQTQDDNAEFKRFDTSFELSKRFTTGTLFTAKALRASQRSRYSLSSPQFSRSGDYTADVLSFSIEQDLLRNFFGRADRAGYQTVRLKLDSGEIQRTSHLQENVLSAIRAFWNTYVAQENFKESLAARERYEKLVDSIRRKNALGYAKPGEFAQVQAELESKIQSSKRASTDYLRLTDDLLTLLRLDTGHEVKFEITEHIPLPPALPAVDPEQTRTLRAQKLLVESADASLRKANSDSLPAVAFVGEIAHSGNDRDPSSSLSEVTSGSNPKYYTGLKVQVSFGSGYQKENILNKRLTKLLEETRMERQTREVKDRLENALREVQSTYNIVQSAQKQRDFRERAVRELLNTYNQGRTDISTYIDAINFYYNSQIGYSRAIGDYQIALNEWAASRDELIPEFKKDESE